MKIKLFVSAMFVLLTCLSVAPAQTKKAVKGIRAVDFRNHTYYFGEDEQAVKIRNGKAKLNSGGDIYEVRKNDVVYGDVNGDGEEDAVVRIRLTTGASLRGFEIQAFRFNSDTGKADNMSRLDMPQIQEDYAKPVCCTGEGLKIVKGHIIFEALTDGEIFLDYKKITTFDYNLSGTELVTNVKPKSRKKPR